MGNKALEPQQNEDLRALVKEIIDRDFEGKPSVAAAAEPRISHSMLFEFLSGGRGAGMRLLEWISARTGRGIDDLLGRQDVSLVESDSDDPYPNRAAVLAFMGHECPKVAVDRIESITLKDDKDRPRIWWAKQLEAAMDMLSVELTRESSPQADASTADSGHWKKRNG